ncbi:hypothetical protein HFP89_00215 [Wenzhouxiangella sp. XN79A]|uniref:hypothetical protein n=1 Tax=Wenzhouxiangella sp. XN79A TaxID=2724193 RepID=UPI00144A9055|nr:hypothetical protein [Wenzhouxiangella sp. XN79A]NKI33586.1 hypothetical protein [Wenzhouxiangella sp. XN79A]
MNSIRPAIGAIGALFLAFSSQSFAQNCDVLDNGAQRPADFPSLQVECGGPGITVDRGLTGGQLTTLFAADNSFAGNTFDLENISSSPIMIQGFEVNLSDEVPTGNANTIDIYYKTGTAVGFEGDPAAWTLLGSDTNVLSQGADVPTPVDVGGLVIQPGETYGFYVDLASYDGTDLILYTNGGPQTFSNGELTLTSNTGQGDPAFTGGSFFPRIWNGTVLYSAAGSQPVPTLGMVGIGTLVLLVLALGLVIVRRNG